AVREKSGFDMEFRIALADGSIKNVQGVGRAILTHSGDISHYIGTTVDITARKHAEALLAGEKRLLEMVARGALLARILDALCRLSRCRLTTWIARVLVESNSLLRWPGVRHLRYLLSRATFSHSATA